MNISEKELILINNDYFSNIFSEPHFNYYCVVKWSLRAISQADHADLTDLRPFWLNRRTQVD